MEINGFKWVFNLGLPHPACRYIYRRMLAGEPQSDFDKRDTYIVLTTHFVHRYTWNNSREQLVSQ